MAWTRDNIESIIKHVENVADAYAEGLRQQLSGVPYGHKRPTSEEIIMLVEDMQRQYPPIPLQYEDGAVRFESPWIAAAELTEQGKLLLDQYEKAKGRGESL